MTGTTLAIVVVVAAAAIFGYLWFRRMRLSVSDTYSPPEEGGEK